MIYHPFWTSNKLLLEKRWAYEQAREREVGEVSEFLGLGAADISDAVPAKGSRSADDGGDDELWEADRRG